MASEKSVFSSFSLGNMCVMINSSSICSCCNFLKMFRLIKSLVCKDWTLHVYVYILLHFVCTTTLNAYHLWKTTVSLHTKNVPLIKKLWNKRRMNRKRHEMNTAPQLQNEKIKKIASISTQNLILSLLREWNQT